MRLLVSVADPQEARAALVGGADLIDAKEPRRGALGAVAAERLRAICDAVGAKRPVSAALGDAMQPARIGRAAQAAVQAGVAFVKVGFRGIESAARVHQLAVAAGAGAGVRVILVGYADWDRVDGARPDVVLDVAAAAGATGVLMDTAIKDVGLFDLVPQDVVTAWVAAGHGAGLLVALAGSLTGPDLRTAWETGADIVGVRGAACIGGRTGSVSAARVAALSALACGASLTRSGALV
jgi:(5-formylfuran-3-yl)methyl phosphate synthase